MKKIALVLVYVSISYMLSAQNQVDPINIGYFFDMNKTAIEGVFDLQYDPKVQLNMSHNAGFGYTPGCYYTLSGDCIHGLILYTKSSSDFKFKSNDEADEIKVKPEECLGFLVGQDSFAVIQNFESNKLLGKQTTKDKVFAEVIDQIDDKTVYVYYWQPYQNITRTYLVSSDAGKSFLTINYDNEINPQAITELFSINDQLVKKVNEERKLASNLHSFLKLYKYNVHFKKGTPILLNSSFDEINNADEAKYLLKVEDIKNDLYRISCSKMDKRKLYEGSFSNVYPHKREGDYILFFPSGEMMKKLIYRDNKLENGKDYYPNGTLHREYTFEQNRYFYTRVNDPSGNNLLSSSFSGKQIIFDSVNQRSITYEYYFRILARTHFTDKKEKMVYQMCQKPASPVSIENLQKLLNKEVMYPSMALKASNHGLVLVKLIIDPMGMVQDFQVVRSTEPMFSNSLEPFLNTLKTRKYWTIPLDKEVKVTQELVLPIDFSIKSASVYRSHNYVNFTQTFMMMQQNMARPGGMGGF
jgi:hypothetical protein